MRVDLFGNPKRLGITILSLLLLSILPIQIANAQSIPNEVLNNSEVKEFVRTCQQRDIIQGCKVGGSNECNEPVVFSNQYVFVRWKTSRIDTCDAQARSNPQNIEELYVAADGQILRRTDQSGTGGAIPLQPSGGLLAYNAQGQIDFGATVPRIITLILMLAAFVAAFFIVQGGFTYVNAQGNDDEVKKGSQTMLMAVLGLIIVMLSIAVVEVATGVLGLNISGIDQVIDGPVEGVQGDKEFFNPTTNP